MGCAKGTEHGQKRGRAEARRSVSTFPVGRNVGFYLQLKPSSLGQKTIYSRVQILGKKRRKTLSDS